MIVLGDINDFDFCETVEILTGGALDPGPFTPDAVAPDRTRRVGTCSPLPATERYSLRVRRQRARCSTRSW